MSIPPLTRRSSPLVPFFQVLKPTLSSSQPLTILGGFLGSVFFVFLLTALANLEKSVFGKGFATKWFEVALCLATTVAASATVHRVCASTAALFSAAMLYGMFRVSQDAYGTGQAGTEVKADKAKKRK